MNDFLSWISMGKYTWFVWPSYGFSALVLVGLYMIICKQHKAHVARLKKYGS